jgi:hypothetical protein
MSENPYQSPQSAGRKMRTDTVLGHVAGVAMGAIVGYAVAAGLGITWQVSEDAIPTLQLDPAMFMFYGTLLGFVAYRLITRPWEHATGSDVAE